MLGGMEPHTIGVSKNQLEIHIEHTGLPNLKTKQLILYILKNEAMDGMSVSNKLKKGGWTSKATNPFASTVAPTLSRLKFEGLIERLENGFYKITQNGLNELNNVLNKEKRMAK